MTLSKLKQSEQILLALVIVSLVVGIYVFFHFIPENKAIVSLQASAEDTQKRLTTARIPDEPVQNVDELLKQLDDQEQALALISSMADVVAERLAPLDSQELKVLISQLARDTKVRVKTNELFLDNTRPTATISPQKSKKSKKQKVSTTVTGNELILPASRSWIERMSADTLFYRPMQRLVLDGDYIALRQFIYGLDALPWQVTVVRLKIEKLPSEPLRGYAQDLKAELVLAL